MGVKALWTILSPVSEKKSLWELEGTNIAIDLSAWICDSQAIRAPQMNMYLRNLFFRTSYLLLNGVKPVFVLEGEAPELKSSVIRKRLIVRSKKFANKPDNGNAPSRSRLKGLQKQCSELLSCLGVKCVKAPGEAEALCARLNAIGEVSGVITQDSDAFLYGAREVYRNFQLSPHFTCDCYRADVIEEKLGLSRTKLIGYSVLAGSDYNNGVSNVGAPTILKFLASLPDNNIFPKFLEWRNGCYFSSNFDDKFISSDKRLELTIRDKALKDEDFPHLDSIAEYLSDPAPPEFTYVWAKPDLTKFVSLAVTKLAWDGDYAAQKFLPILGRWLLINGEHPSSFTIISILSNGKGRNSSNYKVAWDQFDVVTMESKDLVTRSYPHLVDAFEAEKQKKRKTKESSKPRKKRKAVHEIADPSPRAFLEKEDDDGVCVSDTNNSRSKFNLSTFSSPDDEGFDLSAIIDGIVSCPNRNPALEFP